MLNIGLLSLNCALSSGIFGFAANGPNGWTLEKVLSLLFLMLAMASLVAGTLSTTSRLLGSLDEV